MNVFKMAWRNVLRNRRRSLVTIAAMAFALWAELIYSGLIPGYMQGMEQDVVGLEVGDLQIHASGYLEKPSIYTAIPDADALLGKLDAAGYAASPHLLAGGLAAVGDQSAGVALRGLDPVRDARVSDLSRHLSVGSWLDPADPKGVVLGRQLAYNLGAKPGSELVVLTQASDGSMANDLYTVRGVLGSVTGSTDRAAVLMNEGAFRDLMALPEGVHEILVRRGDVPLEQAAAAVRALAPEQDVQTWQQLMPVVAQMMQGTQGIIYVLFFIIYIAVGILILNAMLMAVFERIREFGVLKAIGAGPGRVLSLILVESVIQTGLAMVVGGVLAIPGMIWMTNTGIDVGKMGGMDLAGVAFRSSMKGIYTPDVLVAPVVMLWVIAIGATLYPAFKAALINPITAIRYR